ncbi:nucleoside-triphosphatase THEP1 [Nanoarchaeota archaeon]
MKIFITGKPGVGKTTLIKKIYSNFPEKFFGFYTEEIRENKERIGFKIITTWGEELLLASKNIRTDYRVKNYFVIKENIDIVSEKILENININKVILIDEIGKMELYSEKFKELVNIIINDEKINVLATINLYYLPMVKNNYIYLKREDFNKIYKKIESIIKNGNKN